jgi:hypothetical protein
MLTSWQVSTALGGNDRSDGGDGKADAEHVSYLAIVIGDSIEINEGKRYRYEGCQARKGVDLTEGERSVTVWGPMIA